MAYDVGTEQQLYEDWKPLLEGMEDDEIARGPDFQLLDEEQMIEQTNLGRGVAVVQPGQNVYPVYRKEPRRDVPDC